MENQSNSDKGLDNNEADVSKQQGINNKEKHIKKGSTGLEYHNYVPQHSSHGRSNARSFGSDHEPGTMR